MLPEVRFGLVSTSFQERKALFNVTSQTLFWKLSCEDNSSSGGGGGFGCFSIFLRVETLPSRSHGPV